jgi:hypothetical protein
MMTTPAERTGSAILALEALAVLLVTGWEIVALVTGDTDDAVSSIALIVLTAIGAVALAAFALAVWRGTPGGGPGDRQPAPDPGGGARRHHGPTPSVSTALVTAIPAVIGWSPSSRGPDSRRARATIAAEADATGQPTPSRSARGRRARWP